MDKRKILIVDDEEDLLRMLKIRLEAAGYEVFEASNGQEGLDKARSLNPDLIILDLMLPRIDGFEVCKILKFDESYQNIPIIIFTARSQSADREFSKEVGADAYMTKPFDEKVLLGKVKELLK